MNCIMYVIPSVTFTTAQPRNNLINLFRWSKCQNVFNCRWWRSKVFEDDKHDYAACVRVALSQRPPSANYEIVSIQEMFVFVGLFLIVESHRFQSIHPNEVQLKGYVLTHSCEEGQ